MITLYHVTLTRNLASIRKGGLKRSFCKGKKPAIWLVPKTGVTWAAMHVAKRHKAAIDELAVLTVQVEECYLARGSVNTFYYLVDVLPEEVITIATFALVQQ